MNGLERCLATYKGEPVDHLAFMPITMMFAGDLIGRKYGEYATDHRVMVEAQIRVAEEFGADLVSGISDPAREAADCGAKIAFFDDQPPAIDEENALFADKAALAKVEPPDPKQTERMGDRIAACQLFRDKVGGELLIEGWVEGPCAQGADMRGINRLMMDFYTDPDFVRGLFEFVTEIEIRFALAQLEVGADLIGVGDAAASMVGPDIYNEFVWPYEKRIVDAIHEAGGLARLHICGNPSAYVDGMGRLGCEQVDLDYPVSVAAAREAMGSSQVLCGNIHPVQVLRDGTPASIQAAVAQCHREAGQAFMVGAGCEVPRETAHANVHAMGEYARSHKPEDFCAP